MKEKLTGAGRLLANRLDLMAARLRRLEKIDGAALKWIAVLTMLIDHTAASMELTEGSVDFVLSIPHGAEIYWVMRLIGRTAFPIFAFLFAEGFYYTRNEKKHLGRLVLFAILSQYPFTMLAYGTWEDGFHGSVILTFAGSFAMLMALKRIWKSGRPWAETALRAAGCAAVIAAAFFFLEWTNSDYGWQGAASVLLFYLLRRWRLLASLLVLVVLSVTSPIEWFAAGGILLIQLYNGKKGRQPKYFFYVFYPAHLLLLYLLRLAIFGG